MRKPSKLQQLAVSVYVPESGFVYFVCIINIEEKLNVFAEGLFVVDGESLYKLLLRLLVVVAQNPAYLLVIAVEILLEQRNDRVLEDRAETLDRGVFLQ